MALYIDEHLPLESSRIKFFQDAARKNRFYEGQFIFVPEGICFYESQRTQEVSPRRRLPFEKVETNMLGEGCFGDVQCVTPSKYHVREFNKNDQWEGNLREKVSDNALQRSLKLIY
jgi:hypothetical protein